VVRKKCSGKIYRARYYDSPSGRFLSQDPTYFSGGINFYAYTINNPVNFVDPGGLLAELYCENLSSSRGGGKNSIFLILVNPTHCYLRVACHGKDVYLELYGPPKGSDYGIPHNDNPFNPGRAADSKKYPVHAPTGMKCCEFEDLLMNADQYEATHLDIYESTGPNSNNFVRNVVGSAGGVADFPANAFGAIGIFDGLSASPLGQFFWSVIENNTISNSPLAHR
jgi:hypothetical protein